MYEWPGPRLARCFVRRAAPGEAEFIGQSADAKVREARRASRPVGSRGEILKIWVLRPGGYPYPICEPWCWNIKTYIKTPKSTQFCRFLYTSTIGRIWV